MVEYDYVWFVFFGVVKDDLCYVMLVVLFVLGYGVGELIGILICVDVMFFFGC